MKPFLLLSYALLVTTCVSAQVVSDYIPKKIFVPNISDARSIGMGKTGVAGTKTSNALFTNPSLLSALNAINITGAAQLVFGRYNSDYYKELDKYNPDTDYSIKFTPRVHLNSFCFGLPVRFETATIPVTLGFGLGYRPTYNANWTRKTTIDSKNFDSETISKIKGGHRTFSLGLSTGIMDMFYFGASFNFSIVTSQKYKETAEITSALGSNSESTREIKYKAQGFYPTFGITVKPIKTLSLGMRVSPPLEMEFEDGEGEEEVNGQGVSSDQDDFDIKFPALFTAGVEWQIVPQFCIATEIQTRAISVIEVDGEDLDIDNGFCFRFGSEVIAGSVPLRLGFSLESFPTSDVKLKLNSLKLDDKPNLMFGPTFGLSIPAGKHVTIDFSNHYQFLSREQATSSSDNSVSGKSYDHKTHLFQFDLGITINIPCKTTFDVGAKAPVSKKPLIEPDSAQKIQAPQPVKRTQIDTPPKPEPTKPEASQTTTAPQPVKPTQITTPPKPESRQPEASQTTAAPQPVKPTQITTPPKPESIQPEASQATAAPQPVKDTQMVSPPKTDSVQSETSSAAQQGKKEDVVPKLVPELTETQSDPAETSPVDKQPAPRKRISNVDDLKLNVTTEIILNDGKKFLGTLIEKNNGSYLLNIEDREVRFYPNVVKDILQ